MSSVARVNRNPLRFIDYRYVFVLIDYIQRQIFGRQIERNRVGQSYGNYVAAFYNFTRFFVIAVDGYQSVVDKFFYGRTGFI